MSINLPHHVSMVLNFLGFAWPEIDEDQLREAADHLRRFAGDAETSANSTQGRMQDLSTIYESQSYTSLVEAWGSQTRNHMDTLIEGCHLLAEGLDVAATGVEVMKDAVIAQLIIAAAEFASIQGAAVLTLGAAEAALPALYAAQNRLLAAILKTFEVEVIGALLDAVIGPLKEKVEHAVNELVFAELAGHVVGPPPGLKVDTQAVRNVAKSIGEESVGNQQQGQALSSTFSSLNFGG